MLPDFGEVRFAYLLLFVCLFVCLFGFFFLLCAAILIISSYLLDVPVFTVWSLFLDYIVLISALISVPWLLFIVSLNIFTNPLVQVRLMVWQRVKCSYYKSRTARLE